MAFSQRTATSGTAASGAGFSITLPTGVATGDFLVVGIADILTTTPNAPTGWTKSGPFSAGTLQAVSVYTAPYSAGLTLAFTNVASVAAWVCNAYFQTGLTAPGALDGSPSATSNSTNNTTISVPQTTATRDGDYGVLVFAWTSAATMASVSGMTVDKTQANSTSVSVSLGHNNTNPIDNGIQTTPFVLALSASNSRKTGVALLLRTPYRNLTGTAAGKTTMGLGGIAQIASLAESPGTSHGFTTSALDTTGANLFVIGVGGINGPWTLTDSKGYAYSQAEFIDGSGFGNNRGNGIYYATGTGGPGHTFTIAGTSNFTALCVAAYSNASASPLGTPSSHVSNGASSTSVPGSITPSVPNALVVTTQGGQDSNATPPTISAGFSAVLAVPPGGGRQMSYLSYQVQTAAVAANPTWTLPTSGANWSTIAYFTPVPSTGPISARRSLTGLSAGLATVAGTISKTTPVAGPALDVTGALGTVLSLPGRLVLGAPLIPAAPLSYKDLTGLVAGQATASAVVLAARLLSGLSPGVATASATPSRKRPLTGLSVGQATASASLSRRANLVGTSAGLAGVTVSLTRRRLLSGLSAGLASASASPTRRRLLTGTSVGQSTATGLVSASAPNYKSLTGTSTGQATASASLTRRAGLIAQAAGQAVATALISRRRLLTGLAQGVAATTASLRVGRSLVALSQGLATTTGVLKAKRSLTGLSQGRATVTGALLLLTGFVSGTSAGRATVAGSLTARRSLTGLAPGRAVATGQLSRARSLSGLSPGRAVASATATRRRPLAGQVQGQGRSTGRLRRVPYGSIYWRFQHHFALTGTVPTEMVRWNGASFVLETPDPVVTWDADHFELAPEEGYVG